VARGVISTVRCRNTRARERPLRDTSPETSFGRADPKFWLTGLVGLTLCLRLFIAITYPLLPDEAFYWWEGHYLAIAYSDLPPLTAWTIRAAAETLGHSEFMIRLPFLAAGILTPVLLARGVVQRGTDRLLAFSIAFGITIASLTFSLALPDALLVLATVAAVHYAARCLRAEGCRANWIFTGLVCAVGFLIHYRFLLVAGLIFAGWLLIRGPAWLLRNPRFWLAAGLATIGLIPIIVFNLEHTFSGVTFQFVDRHPWSFQPRGLLFPLVQVFSVSPPLFILIVWAFSSLSCGLCGSGWLGFRRYPRTESFTWWSPPVSY